MAMESNEGKRKPVRWRMSEKKVEGVEQAGWGMVFPTLTSTSNTSSLSISLLFTDTHKYAVSYSAMSQTFKWMERTHAHTTRAIRGKMSLWWWQDYESILRYGIRLEQVFCKTKKFVLYFLATLWSAIAALISPCVLPVARGISSSITFVTSSMLARQDVRRGEGGKRK